MVGVSLSVGCHGYQGLRGNRCRLCMGLLVGVDGTRWALEGPEHSDEMYPVGT